MFKRKISDCWLTRPNIGTLALCQTVSSPAAQISHQILFFEYQFIQTGPQATSTICLVFVLRTSKMLLTFITGLEVAERRKCVKPSLCFSVSKFALTCIDANVFLLYSSLGLCCPHLNSWGGWSFMVGLPTIPLTSLVDSSLFLPACKHTSTDGAMADREWALIELETFLLEVQLNEHSKHECRLKQRFVFFVLYTSWFLKLPKHHIRSKGLEI